MKRVFTAVVGTVAGLVLLLSFKTHPLEPNTLSTSSNTVTQPADTSPGRTTTTVGRSDAAKTVTGDAASTRYGPVQVQLTYSSGKITDIQVVAYPNTNGRDRAINSRAVPELTSQALAAQGVNIDGVSGASYTTQGFVTSLRSALSKAES